MYAVRLVLFEGSDFKFWNHYFNCCCVWNLWANLWLPDRDRQGQRALSGSCVEIKMDGSHDGSSPTARCSAHECVRLSWWSQTVSRWPSPKTPMAAIPSTACLHLMVCTASCLAVLWNRDRGHTGCRVRRSKEQSPPPHLQSEQSTIGNRSPDGHARLSIADWSIRQSGSPPSTVAHPPTQPPPPHAPGP